MSAAEVYSDREDDRRPVAVQIVGYKNTGKTTLVCRLAELLKEAGYKVGTIKHDAHEFQMDHPGTDTWKHQQSGADMTAISSSSGTALVSRHPSSLNQLIRLMADMDFVLVEGYKQENYPKILLIKNEADLELARSLKRIVAIALWPEASERVKEALPLCLPAACEIPVFPIDDASAMVAFIQSQSV